MWHRVLICLFSLTLVFSTLGPCALAYAEVDNGGADELVRIAIPVAKYASEDESSIGYEGYVMEFLYDIAQYTGWTYEVVRVPGDYEDSLSQAVDLIESGEVDLLAPVQLLDGLGDVSFSQNPMALVSSSLRVPNEVYDGVDLNGLVRVAAIDDRMAESAREYIERGGGSVETVICRSIDEQIDAVIAGTADAMVNSSLELIPDTTEIAKFDPMQLYFASADEALLDEVDAAIVRINEADPQYAAKLNLRFFSGASQSLSLGEQSFIKESESYTVAVLDNQEPYQYVDAETGECEGIMVDMLRYIASSTGLRFEFRPVSSWEEVDALLEEGSVQVVAGVPYNYEFAAKRNLTISQSVTSSPYVLAAKSSFDGIGGGKKLAMMKDSSYTEGYYVGDVVVYDSMGDCMEAVRSGEADYTYVDLYTAQYYMTDSDYAALELEPQAYDPRAVSFGLSKPTPHELINIFNKMIGGISDQDMQALINQNVNTPRDMTIIDVIKARPIESVSILLVAGIIVIALFVILTLRSARLNGLLKKRVMQDGLTTLYNSSACRHLVTQKLKDAKSKQTGAFLIIDIDYFKEVNDRYGHQVGDSVLEQFADVLKRSIREGSVVARIGGDEFVAYLTDVHAEENIDIVCERILEGARSIKVKEGGITVSIGAVASKHGDDYDSLYHIADSALYEAKRAGRNQFRRASRWTVH